MSYKQDPEWTKDFVLPSEMEFKCPHCRHVPSSTDAIDVCKSVTYYAARHIPPFLSLTCTNPDCQHCDEDFEVHLRCVVTITKIEVA